MLIVDDHPMWRESLRRLLERKQSARVVGEASAGEQALDLARQERPDVVVMDVDMPGLDGIETTRRLLQHAPDMKILFLSALEERDDIVAALRAGACGYLLKTAASEDVLDAIRRIAAGELVFPPELASIVRDELRADTPGRRSTRRSSNRNAFILEGEFWTLTFDGTTVRIRDSKGVRYIAELLRSPGRSIHSVELALVTEGHEVVYARASRRAASGDLEAVQESRAPAADSPARRAYRARLEELQEQIDEAEEWGDPSRASEAKAEMESIAAELAKSMGFGARSREPGSPTERARLNVTRAISSAIGRIESAHPGLGLHLRKAVRTGTFCSYVPESATPWTL